MKLEWTTEQRVVKDLIPSGYNPRILTEARRLKLVASLEKYNLVEIPVINIDGTIVAGHQRLKVMIDLNRGEEVIDVRVPNRQLSDLELREYMVTSNVSIGFWDIDMLDEAFDDINLEGLGMDLDAIRKIDIGIPEEFREEEEDINNVIISTIPVSKEGDFVVLKSLDKDISHRIFCGSSTEEHSWNLILDQYHLLDLLLTDPPYNVNYTGGTDKQLKIMNDKMSDGHFYQFLLDFYSCAISHLAEGSAFYIFHADSEGANFRKALIDAGGKLTQCLIWVKNSIVMGRQDYHWQHEPILYGWRPGKAHKWYSDRKQSTVLYFDKPQRNDEHPTMKPLDILEYMIQNSTKVYNHVGDGFLGSGSTLMACEKTCRQCHGMELDPIYFDVIIRRWVLYMRDNNLKYSVEINGKTLTENELEKYIQVEEVSNI